MLQNNRHRYSLVSAVDVCPGFPAPVFEIEQNSSYLYNPLNCGRFASVPTALEGTLLKTSQREYRPKRVPERANGGMEWIWLGTLERAGRPENSGVQADKRRFQRTGNFAIWRRARDSNTRYVIDLQASDNREDNFRNLDKKWRLYADTRMDASQRITIRLNPCRRL